MKLKGDRKMNEYTGKEALGCLTLILIGQLIVSTILLVSMILWLKKITIFLFVASLILMLPTILFVIVGHRVERKKELEEEE